MTTSPIGIFYSYAQVLSEFKPDLAERPHICYAHPIKRME
jgi:hypothetical protein